MAYFRLKFLKDNVGIEQEDAGPEDELKQLGAESDGWVDDNLKDLLTVPIASPSEQIKVLSETRAAGRWQLRKGGDPSKKPYLLTEADNMLALIRERIMEAGENTKRGTVFGKTTGNITTQ